MIAAIISALIAIFGSGYFVMQRNNKRKQKKRFNEAADDYFKSIGVNQKKDQKNGRNA
jgi:hypothetical protein